MSSTILYRGYTVTSSLGERNIFLKLVDQVSFANYEASLEQKDFRLQHDLPSIYKVMLSTFAEKDENFKVDISILSGFMKLNFHALVGGFLNVQFEVVLREKVVATEVLQSSKMEQALRELEEDKLTKESLLNQLADKVCSNAEHIMTLNETLAQQGTKLLEMEQTVAQQNQIIQQLREMQDKLHALEEQSEALSKAEIDIEGHAVAMSIEELSLKGRNGLDKLQHLYRLRKLSLSMLRQPLKSKTLEEVQIGERACFDFEFFYLPNLKKLTIDKNASGRINGHPVNITQYCYEHKINLIHFL